MKTIILKWNPAISSVTMDDMKGAIAYRLDDEFLEANFNWSIYEWEKAEKGDRVFMLRVGRGKTGIIGSGWLASNPYEDDDWNGTAEKRHYADILFDTMIFPLGNDILKTKALQAAIPSVNWTGGHSGVVITNDEAEALEKVWRDFLITNHNRLIKADGTIFKSLINKAWGIAINAHKGQKDKGGNDYFESHVIDVFEKMAPVVDNDGKYTCDPPKIIALLHDVVEDTGWTLGMLREQGFSKRIIEAVDCLTRRDGESYDDFIKRLKPDRIARYVKIADLENNMDIRRLNEITDADVERLRRYLKAYKYLEAE